MPSSNVEPPKEAVVPGSPGHVAARWTSDQERGTATVTRRSS
jgi:hypothetical protein